MTANEAMRKEIASLRRRLAEEKRLRKEESRKAADEIRALRAALAEALGAVAALGGEVEDLKARLGQNSSNSSLPPSKDPPSAPAPKSLRPRTGRRPGGQRGHEGATLELSDAPDEVVVHEPAACGRCGASLREAPAVGFDRRQVVDVPPVVPHVTEHRIVTKECACGRRTRAAAPPGAGARAQYGPRAEALTVYFYQAQSTSLARCAELLRDAFGLPASPATVLGASRRAADKIDRVFGPHARRALAGGRVLHVDETSIKQNRGKAWLHSASNPSWTWITAHRRRGREGTDAAGILPRFHGFLVHDCWSVYDSYPQVAGHQLCAAHGLRELQAVADRPGAGPAAGAWRWEQQTADALRAAIHDPSGAARARHLILSAVNVALDDPGTDWAAGKQGKKHRALARRFKDRVDDYLRFTADPEIPPTNNPAEQEIRVAKIRAKVSGTMRTMKGAQTFASIRSYLSTARKHGQRPLAVLASLTSPDIWLPATP
jgi:transposase